MTVYLVRNALAAEPGDWQEPDELRPLTPNGHRQARGLLEVLADVEVDRVVASPRERCTETVRRLAEDRGLSVEHADEIDIQPVAVDEAIAFLLSVADEQVVACAPEEVLAPVMERLVEQGLQTEDRLVYAKACTWELEAEDGRFATARYRRPQTA